MPALLYAKLIIFPIERGSIMGLKSKENLRGFSVFVPDIWLLVDIVKP
jgi:hypothetical protein